jgi:hypothetical protein
MALLPLRYPASGPPYDARDGVIVVLFVRESHVALAPTIGALFDAYLASRGARRRAAVHRLERGVEAAHAAATRQRARRRLSAAAANGLPNEYLEMKGGCGEG